jgi:hypothetical protein
MAPGPMPDSQGIEKRKGFLLHIKALTSAKRIVSEPVWQRLFA